MAKRPMLIITVCYIVGIFIGLYLHVNIAFFVCMCIIIFLLFAVYVFMRHALNLNFNKNIPVKILISGIVTILISATLVYNVECKNKVMTNNMPDKTQYTGTVIDVQRSSTYYDVYTLKVQKLESYENNGNIIVLLRVKKNNKSDGVGLEYGDVVNGIGSIEIPEVR